jgi:cytosine/adenosine deaminase-related metal-dependent hydrolase
MQETRALRAGWVLLRDGGHHRLHRNATVVVRGSRIDAVLPAGAAGAPAGVVDLGDSLLMPGFVNTHSHSVSAPLFRALLEDRSFAEGQESVIDKIMMPLGEIMSEILGEDEIEAVAALGQLEALKAGSTTIVDMPRANHDAFGRAARKIGLRAYIHPYLISGPQASWSWDDDGADDPDVERAMATFWRWRERFDEGSGGRIRIGLGPHATDTCAPALARQIARVRDQTGAPITVHLAQGLPEMTLAQQRFGSSPVVYYDRVGLLDARLLAAHCVYAKDEDLALMAERGVTIAHCPISYARSGRLAARSRFLRAGVRTTIGTDANAVDIIADLRMAAINSKLESGDGTAGSAWELVEAATATAAEVLGRSDLGRIEPGATADLIAINLAQAHLQPVYDPIKVTVWNGTGRDVDFVMVAGEVLVKDGRFTRGPEQEIVAAGAAAMQRVWRRAEERRVIEPVAGPGAL